MCNGVNDITLMWGGEKGKTGLLLLRVATFRRPFTFHRRPLVEIRQIQVGWFQFVHGKKKYVSYPGLSQTYPAHINGTDSLRDKYFSHPSISVIHHFGLQGSWNPFQESLGERQEYTQDRPAPRGRTLTTGAAASAQTRAALWTASLTVDRQKLASSSKVSPRSPGSSCSHRVVTRM